MKALSILAPNFLNQESPINSNPLPVSKTATLWFFEVGQWWDYLMLIVVIAALAGAAWLTQRYKWAVLTLLVALPIALTIFWWPYSTVGTESAGWFPIVKQYSALIGSLSLVALQYFPAIRTKSWYLCLPPLILAINIAEAVVRDFQVYGMNGVDPKTNMFIIGGPWNIVNGVAGILNLLIISGWMGIYISRRSDRAVIWPDLTIWWIIAYDLWNLSYVYNCLPNRAWYSGVALLISCTIPALLPFGRGAWIQYRAYTLTFWSGVVLTFPAFMSTSPFAHASSYNPSAMWTLAILSISTNVALSIYHLYRIITGKRNPFRQEIYADTKSSQRLYQQTADRTTYRQIQLRNQL